MTIPVIMLALTAAVAGACVAVVVLDAVFFGIKPRRRLAPWVGGAVVCTALAALYAATIARELARVLP